MAYHPFRNLGLKFLSTLVAALLWLIVAGERVVERVMRAPVEFQNLPAGLELVGNPPDTVEVRLRGSSGALSRMGAGDMSAVIDLSSARPGRRLFHITQNQVNVPYGIEIVQVGPSTLTMEFEMSAIRKVPVEPDIDGHPAAGYEVTSIKSEPDTVEVAGPESALKRLQAAITEPVAIADQTRSVREVVTIGVPDSTLRLRAPQTAIVTVTISPIRR
ncbi:MAG TPA: CdaR family protein [Vicinamibacterales bacterium]|nr:CdaR family protein [Vicinamibacterales bacterium]